MRTITSSHNSTLKEARKLMERRHRDQTDRFLIEGYRELLRAQSARFPIETLFICPSLFLGINEEELIEGYEKQGVEIISCIEKTFRMLSYRDRPDGLIAIAEQRHLTLDDLPKKASPLYLIAESIEKPGNLGTILRSADAAGADGVIVCDRCTDLFNPNVVRASVGTLFTVPVVEAAGEEALQWLQDNQIAIVAATPSAQKNYTEVDLTRGVAIAVGTEQFGLSRQWMEQASIQVKIPMHGVADSLNVAMATTLLLYEVVRQRGE